jgi:regulator of replication initiation timing
MLIKERELFGESNIKLVVKENEDMRIENVRLRELNKQIKIQEQQRVSEKDRAKSQADSKEIL